MARRDGKIGKGRSPQKYGDAEAVSEGGLPSPPYRPATDDRISLNEAHRDPPLLTAGAIWPKSNVLDTFF